MYKGCLSRRVNGVRVMQTTYAVLALQFHLLRIIGTPCGEKVSCGVCESLVRCSIKISEDNENIKGGCVNRGTD